MDKDERVLLGEDDLKQNQNSGEVDQVIELVLTLLTSASVPKYGEIDEALRERPGMQKLYNNLIDLRALASALNKGDLGKFVDGKGFLLSVLKSLQSNLRHLNWQIHQIVNGDFSQEIDFLGEISLSYSQLKEDAHKLYQLANVDTLTQIPNRMALESFLLHEFEVAKTNSSGLNIFIIDIDHFKAVNDTYGHDIGDKVLVMISDILNRQFRNTDIFARYGGEEFVAVLVNVDLETAFHIAQRSRAAVAAMPVYVDPQTSVPVTISIGLSGIMPEDNSFNDILKRSDMALYNAKGAGRNQVCLL